MKIFFAPCVQACTVLLLLTGCMSEGKEPAATGGIGLLGNSAAGLTTGAREGQQPSSVGFQQSGPNPTGFVEIGPGGKGASPELGRSAEGVTLTDDGTKVTLNFVNSDVQEFLRVVFDEVLKQTIVIDSSLQGKITVRTTEPVSKKTALELVKNVLQVNGIALTQANGIFRVSARQSPGQQVERGNVRVVPLKFLEPEQARAAIQPLAGGVQISVSQEGRYLILSGPPADLDSLLQAIDALDVDAMRGFSLGLYPLKEAGAQAVTNELMQMFQGSDKGFKAIPIQRMNAVLVMSRNAGQLGRVQAWLRRLDQSGKDERKVFVYPVQNRRASDLAQILSGILGVQASGAPASSEKSKIAPAFNPPLVQPGLPTPVSMPTAADAPDSLASVAIQPAGDKPPPVQVKADLATNSVVVVGKPEEFRMIEAALRRLDIMPAQVLIEATIAEVTLNDTLSHGVRWYLQSGNHSSLFTGSDQGSVSEVVPGFNYAFTVPQGRVVISALEQVTDVEIISSPALTVLDNQTATLKVGDQVPIATRSARSNLSPDAPTVNEIEMKDTGIILNVTPRVNAGGLVSLDVSQEVSDVVPTTTSTLDSPTIRQRKITSSISSQSGDEIVLGGLISSKNEKGKSGIPVLMDIPVIGNAFVSNGKRAKGRTELLIIIRPTVISNRLDVQAVTSEIKAKMQQTSSAIYR